MFTSISVPQSLAEAAILGTISTEPANEMIHKLLCCGDLCGLKAAQQSDK